MRPRDTAALDGAFFDGLATVLADYSDRQLGRIIGLDHKTAAERKANSASWRHRELARLADSDDKVRALQQARHADVRDAANRAPEREAANTISDAGDVIAALMRSMADSHITAAEARQCLVKALHLKAHLETLIGTLDQRVRESSRGRR